MGNVFIVRSKRVFTAERGVDVPRELAFAVELPVGASNAEGSGRIAHIGAPDDVIAAYPAGTPIMDFGDRFICPGFHDAHLHFFHTAVYNSPYVLMHMGESEAELVARTREFAAALPPSAWVVTQGWRDYRWNPPVPPTKCSLDEAFPDRPCAMCSGDGHTLWLNSRALEALGVHRDSEPPAGGIYDRDENGELTGIIREAAAMELQPRLLEWLTQADFERAYTEQMARMAGQGITSICDMSLMPLPGCDFIREDIYEALDARGALTLRAHLFPTLLDDQTRLERMQERYGAPTASTLIKAPGFKQFFDGVSSQHTAWVTEPYANAHVEGDCGRPTVDPEIMRRYVLAAAEQGFPVRIHAIGDAAIHAALDIFEEARAKFGPLPEGRRNCLEHLENFLPGDMKRLADLQVVAAVQPPHMTLDPGGPERDLGPERVPYMWPFRTLLDDNTVLAFGTDSPVVGVNSMDVLYSAVTRQDPGTHEPTGGWLHDERIGMAEALRAYTQGSAASAGRRSELGTLEAGKLADIAVLDRNLLACDADDIQKTKVLATFMGGTCVFER